MAIQLERLEVGEREVMQTQYGKLPIVVDPTTGRATVVRGGVVRDTREEGRTG